MGQNAYGMILRFTPIKGITPVSALSSAIRLPAVLNTPALIDTALHNEYDTLSAGQFSQPAMGPASARQLRELPVDSLLMWWDPDWFVWTGQDPDQLRDTLQSILHSKKPVHALATLHPSGAVTFEDDVTFRSMTEEHRPGEVDTAYFSLDLKSWRDPRVAVLGHRSGSSGGSSNPTSDLPTTFTLTASDTLYSIAKKFYGSYQDWRLIRDANGIAHNFGASATLVGNTRFKAGQKLKIPALPAKSNVTSGGAGL